MNLLFLEGLRHIFLPVLYFPTFLPSRILHSRLSALNTQAGFLPHRNWRGSDDITVIHTRHLTPRYLSQFKKGEI